MNHLPPGDLYHIVYKGTVLAAGGTNRVFINSWWYLADHLTGGGGFPTAPVWAAFESTVWSQVKTVIIGGPNGYVPVDSFGTIIEGSVVWFHNDVVQAAPPNVAARMPTSTAMCVGMHCAARGRPYQGRKFLGPVYIGVGGDEVTPGQQALWQAAANTFLLPLTVVFGGVNWTLRPVILSQLYSTFVAGATGLVGDFLTSVSVPKTYSSWRHRRERTVR